MRSPTNDLAKDPSILGDLKELKNNYLDAASKAYYAIFQAARAALATLAIDSSKHSGVIRYEAPYIRKTVAGADGIRSATGKISSIC